MPSFAQRPEYDAVEYEQKVMGALARAQLGRGLHELEDSWEEPWPGDDKLETDEFDPLRDESDEDAPVFKQPQQQGYSALREVMRVRTRRSGSLGGAVHKLGNFADPDHSDQEDMLDNVRASKPISPAVSPSKRRPSILGMSCAKEAHENSPGKKSPAKKMEAVKETMQEKVATSNKPKGRKRSPKNAKTSQPSSLSIEESINQEITHTPMTLRKTSTGKTSTASSSMIETFSKEPVNQELTRTPMTLRKTPKGKTPAASPSVVEHRLKTPKSSTKRTRQAVSDDDSGSERLFTTPRKKGAGRQSSIKSPGRVPTATPTSRLSGLRV